MTLVLARHDSCHDSRSLLRADILEQERLQAVRAEHHEE